MSKKYLDSAGLNKFASMVLSKFAAKNHSHSSATTNSAGFMSANDKVKLDGVAAGANKTIVDSTLSSTSVNAIQNKAVKTALDGKASSSHTHPTSQITGLDSALAGKADKSHTHDDRYYTESEANSKFSPIGGSASLNKLSENVTLGNGSAGSIVQNSGTYHQKFEILDDANAGTDTFVFSQSTDSGAKFTKLMSIRDDGNVVANKFTGALSGNAASASSVPWSGVTGKPSTFSPSGHSHDASAITSGVLPVSRGGTGASTAEQARNNIMVYSKSEIDKLLKKRPYILVHESPGVTVKANRNWAYGYTYAALQSLLGITDVDIRNLAIICSNSNATYSQIVPIGVMYDADKSFKYMFNEWARYDEVVYMNNMFIYFL